MLFRIQVLVLEKKEASKSETRRFSKTTTENVVLLVDTVKWLEKKLSLEFQEDQE